MGLTIHSGELKDRLLLIADDLRRSSAIAAQAANDLRSHGYSQHLENLELVRKVLIEDEYFLLSCARDISEGIIIKVPRAASSPERA